MQKLIVRLSGSEVIRFHLVSLNRIALDLRSRFELSLSDVKLIGCGLMLI